MMGFIQAVDGLSSSELAHKRQILILPWRKDVAGNPASLVKKEANFKTACPPRENTPRFTERCLRWRGNDGKRPTV